MPSLILRKLLRKPLDYCINPMYNKLSLVKQSKIWRIDI